MTDGKSPDETGVAPVRARPLGPEELKAFTHPLRMAMYMALRDGGPATASQLGRRLGQSSGDTSYHLRQLERFGFVEDDPHHSGGRERWWRSVGFSVEDPQLLQDPAAALAVRTLIDRDIADRAAVLRRWADAVFVDGALTEEKAQILDTVTADMTTTEAEAMINAVQLVLEEHTERAAQRRDAGETEGRRRTRIYFDVVPLTFDEDAG